MQNELDGYKKVAKMSEIPEGGKITVEANGQLIVLVRIDGEVFCVDDVCTHDGGTLGDGELDDHCLICPRHGAKFDVRTGAAVTMPATEATVSYEVKLVGDDVLVCFN